MGAALANDPAAIATALTLFGALLGTAAILSRASGRLGLPVILVFLALGVVVGSSGHSGPLAHLADPRLAFQIGSVALVAILFDGGLNTHARLVREAAVPASLLATVGVAGTAAV